MVGARDLSARRHGLVGGTVPPRELVEAVDVLVLFNLRLRSIGRGVGRRYDDVNGTSNEYHS